MDTTLRIFDVQEKEVGAVKAPSFPAPTQSSTGFPEHKKRAKTSAFKQRRQAEQAPGGTSDSPRPEAVSAPQGSTGPASSQHAVGPPRPGFSADESKRIARENEERIEQMSGAEIEAAQKEIFNALDPSLIERLLRRANLDEAGPSPFDAMSNAATPSAEAKPQVPELSIEDVGKPGHTGSAIKSASTRADRPKKTVTFDEDAAPPAPPVDPPPSSATNSSTHFPSQKVPDLDPNDPDFLENLHKKFFPNLPADPSKLAWMAPLPTPNSTADRESPYYPGQESLPVSALRFDFHGKLIPPRLSRQIPVTKGLHHHGVAPEAAGYTIPELARLARSAVPGQRCIAYQTLGRMLFRLGNGEWGIGEGGRAGEEDDLAFGMWRCFLETRVLDTLIEAASVEDGAGHMASKAYAVEALWLFEKGGWKEKWRGM